MLVYRLPLVVIFGMADSVASRDRLRRLIRLEAQIPCLMLLGANPIPEAVVTEHEVVMSLHVLGIDRQNGLKFPDRFSVFLLQKQNAPCVVPDHPVLRE